MGAYHGKSHKNVTTEPISVASASDPAPPVFGSPIDRQSTYYINIYHFMIIFRKLPGQYSQ